MLKMRMPWPVVRMMLRASMTLKAPVSVWVAAICQRASVRSAIMEQTSSSRRME